MSPLEIQAREVFNEATRNVPDMHPLDLLGAGSICWNYFKPQTTVDAEGTVVEKSAICQVRNSEGICGAKLMCSGCSTTGMRGHLEQKHPVKWAEGKVILAARRAAKAGASKGIEKARAVIEGTEGTPVKQADKNPLGFRILARSKEQLRWDLHVTRLICQGSLPFAFVQSDAWKDFHNCPELRKYHIKNPTTYSRAKLPLLYKQVKAGIELKIKRDLPGTKGFAFTADMWTAR